MSWETKTLKTLDQQYDNDDNLKQTWSISRRVDESQTPPKQFARELQRTVFWNKNGEHKSFAVTLTRADFHWILANKEIIEAALKPSPKPSATPAPAPVSQAVEGELIEDSTF